MTAADIGKVVRIRDHRREPVQYAQGDITLDGRRINGEVWWDRPLLMGHLVEVRPDTMCVVVVSGVGKFLVSPNDIALAEVVSTQEQNAEVKSLVEQIDQFESSAKMFHAYSKKYIEASIRFGKDPRVPHYARIGLCMFDMGEDFAATAGELKRLLATVQTQPPPTEPA